MCANKEQTIVGEFANDVQRIAEVLRAAQDDADLVSDPNQKAFGAGRTGAGPGQASPCPARRGARARGARRRSALFAPQLTNTLPRLTYKCSRSLSVLISPVNINLSLCFSRVEDSVYVSARMGTAIKRGLRVETRDVFKCQRRLHSLLACRFSSALGFGEQETLLCSRRASASL